MPSGLVFDFTNMFGENRLQQDEVAQAIVECGSRADAAVRSIRAEGVAKNHLSKDGTPEHVYFTRMPYVAEGNPNTEASIIKLLKYSKALRQQDVVVFLGVGGSYLGNKVLFDAFGGCHWNTNSTMRQGQPRIYFSGNNLDPVDCNGLVYEVERLAARHAERGQKLKVMLVPISKSGTTLETISAFTYFFDVFQKDPDIALDCTVVTDLTAAVEQAPLLQLAQRFGWERFDIKEGIGGRFCVMTDPGLVTMAALGSDIEEFLRGAREMDRFCQQANLEENPALLNALLKYMAYRKGREIEVFMPYSMHLKSLSEWYVQLLAESLGKRYDRSGKIVNYGRTPIVAVGTTDMHAQTQQHQDGRLNKVVQFLEIANPEEEAVIHNPFADVPFFKKYDGLDMNKALKVALAANEAALSSDNRYNAKFTLPKLNEYYLGQMMYFLMLSVAYEGELADVDAYDQPGVEVYKRIMKAQL
ncbi:glucose-6-phosphate isomerase [uncultured Phascolarctobacterium sp.]|uniref:glucose-6-phosphate isomerase n=1 Tax=uncultured Phascolarctobacterium sp. TaxID=512296 RepID=UPI0035A61DD3